MEEKNRQKLLYRKKRSLLNTKTTTRLLIIALESSERPTTLLWQRKWQRHFLRVRLFHKLFSGMMQTV